MKDIITIIIILALILGGAYLTSRYLKQTTGELITQIGNMNKKLEKALETDERKEIIEEAERIQNMWEQIEKVWGIIILHEELDNIKSSIYKLRSNAEYGEIHDCLEEVEKLKFLIGHIREKDQLSIVNIF